MSISSLTKTRFRTLKVAAAALLLATASMPTYAGGWHGGGYHGGYYHGGYYHGGYYHGGCCYNSSAGWWIGGALALGVAGAVIAANSQPTYYGPPVVYSPPVYAAPYPAYPAPVYAAPAPVYAAPPSPYVPPAPSGLIAYPAKGQSQAQQNRDRAECEHWASGQSGMDPNTMTKYTTGVSVDSYNRAMSACMTGRGYSVS